MASPAALVVVESKTDPYWEHAARNLIMGIFAKHLAAVGYGKTQLLDPSNADSGVNRRVQIANQGR